MAECEKVYSKMEFCIAEVRTLMVNNFLCLNDSKTEVVFFGTKCNLSKEPQLPLRIGEELIEPSAEARILGSFLMKLCLWNTISI